MAEQIKAIGEVDGKYRVLVSNPIEVWRCETFKDKEPETIAWLDSMKPGDVLYDIGANIGIYTLYAASRGVQVVAVEPVLENYMRLVENIELNGFDNVIPIYGACGSGNDPHWFTDIAIPDCTIGASGAQIMGKEGKLRRVPCYELEYLIYSLDLAPTHIKIDVDGQEKGVINGLYSEVESILVEINHEQWAVEDAIQELRDMGFIPDPLFNEHRPHSSERRQREGISAVNVVFKREEV